MIKKPRPDRIKERLAGGESVAGCFVTLPLRTGTSFLQALPEEDTSFVTLRLGFPDQFFEHALRYELPGHSIHAFRTGVRIGLEREDKVLPLVKGPGNHPRQDFFNGFSLGPPSFLRCHTREWWSAGDKDYAVRHYREWPAEIGK